MGLRMRWVRGFTLIELLVVVAIIVLLMAIMLPSLGKAREVGKRAQCGSNLHQLMNAWYMYAQDSADVVMTARDYTLVPAHPTWASVYWNGAYDVASTGTTVIPQYGFIYPYASANKLAICPSIDTSVPLSTLGYSYGYGYNWQYMSYQDWAGATVGGGHTVNSQLWTKLVSIPAPASKVAFADCARNIKANPSGMETTPFLGPPSQQYPSFHGRHVSSGNVAWVDGHVSVEKPQMLRSVYHPNGTASITVTADQVKAFNLGDIDADNSVNTDDSFNLQ